MMNEVDRTPLVTKASELMLTHVQFTALPMPTNSGTVTGFSKTEPPGRFLTQDFPLRRAES
jgi:hypothetical protein